MNKISILFLLLLIKVNLASSIFSSLQSLSANFEQEITNEYNQTITYKGKIFLKKPFYSKWAYTYPVKKTIYITKNKLAIIDNELEQVTIASLNNQLNFIEILKNAKKVSTNYYKAKYANMQFDIYLKKSKIHKITYKDETENDVQLVFKKTKINKKINKKIFTYKMPTGYDIVKQ